MTASVGNIVLYILFLWIAPVFVGNAICNRLSMRGTIPRSFVMGYLSMWAVFQIITVPLILLKVSFLVDVVVYSMFLIGIIVYGIVKKTYCSMTIPKVEPSAWVGIIVMLATGIYMIVQSFRLQLTNADDTRFVVNAVDTVRTNRMLLTDVNTGKEILSWTGDLFKDVISPWAVFAAYLSKITGISAASMMHTFLPPVLLAVMMCIFWLVAGELFDKHIYRALFVILLLVMYMYGYFSIYNAETFTIPHHRVCQLFDRNFECFIFIEGMRQSDLFPLAVIECCIFGFRKISCLQFPFAVEIVLFTFTCLSLDGGQCDQ